MSSNNRKIDIMNCLAGGQLKMDISVAFLEMSMSLSAILIYAYMYWRFRDRAIGIFLLAAALFFGTFVMISVFVQAYKTAIPPLAQYIKWSSFILCSSLICWGIAIFVQKPFLKQQLYGGIGCLILNVINHFFYSTYFIDVLIFCYNAVFLTLAGARILGHPKFSGIWKYIASLATPLLGLLPLAFVFMLKLDSSVRVHGTGYLPHFYLGYAIIGDFAAIGYAILYFQRRISQDDVRHYLLQAAAHELKTQAMIVRNYAQMIVDGILPEENLAESLKAINSETQLLEKRVRRIMYLQKLDAVEEKSQKREAFDLADLLRENIKRFSFQRPEIVVESSLQPVLLTGDREQWTVALENLLENQMRYALSRIRISLVNNRVGGNTCLHIWNDGPSIEPRLQSSLFREPQTGKGGEFGLGLMIVKKIMDLHRAEIRAENAEHGAAFIIEIGK